MALIYFVSQSGDIIALDGTESVEVSKDNSVSKSSMMDGTTISDGYSEGNKVISISGKVTYSKSLRQQLDGTPTPLQFQRLIQQTERNHERFTLRTYKGSWPLLDDIKDCVIASNSVSITEYLDTIDVTLTIEQVFVSKSARTTYLAPQRTKQEGTSASVADTEDSTGGKGATEEKDNRTIALALAEDGTSYVNKILGL
ncbi:hypothetical protein KUA24_45 [Vibrio phage HNL01]|nr:hypothetical protein KUA24_45 [Vibrio phage HNL01]